MRKLHFVLAFGLCASPGAPVAAQTAAVAARPDTASADGNPFFTTHDALLLFGFTAGVIAIAPLDKEFAHTLQDERFQESRIIKGGANFFQFMGQPAPQIIGVGLYGVGRLTHSTRVQKLGLHGLEAMVLSNVIVETIKHVAGRARPFVHQDSAAYDFAFMRGFKGRDYQSFPSGHTTTAFAAASAVAAETSHWINESHWNPNWKIAVGTVMYGGAALVGLSRVYHDQHWASDVLAGAAIGTFSGTKTVKYAYRHPRNIIERTLIATTVVPASNGATYFAWSFKF